MDGTAQVRSGSRPIQACAPGNRTALAMSRYSFRPVPPSFWL